MSNPSYFSILTAEVRYSKEISDGEKILFSEITALTQKYGYCVASNSYFSKLYGVSKQAISNRINNLEKAGFIRCEIDEKNGNNRKIFLVILREKGYTPQVETYTPQVETPIHNSCTPYTPQVETYNNTSLSIQERTKKKSRKKEKIEILTFGEKVKLPLPAYEKLIAEFGELKIVEYIEKINTYLTTTENGLKKGEYKNYAMTIRNWIASDGNGSSANHSPQQAQTVAAWKEKAAYLSNGRKDSDWWAQSGEDNQTWAKRVVTWLKVGLDKHWDIERQNWRMDTEVQEAMVKKLYFHARDILQGKAV